MTFRPPLAGVRVLETASGDAAAYAGRLLADMGAEVIMIEAEAAERTPVFNTLNRNKYGVSLDAAANTGRDAILRLVEVSDAVIDGTGLDYDSLRARNGEIIAATIAGPDADLSAGAAAAAAVAIALWDRRRTGRGGHIEVDAAAVALALAGDRIVARSVSGREPPRTGHRHPTIAPHGVYPASGGRDIALACPDDAAFAALCRAIGQPELSGDSRFADAVSRKLNEDDLDGLVAAWTRERTPEAAAEALQAAGVPASPVLSAADLASDPHLRERGAFEPVSHVDGGVSEIQSPHWRMSETPAHIRLPAPAFGQHDAYALRHLLASGDQA